MIRWKWRWQPGERGKGILTRPGPEQRLYTWCHECDDAPPTHHDAAVVLGLELDDYIVLTIDAEGYFGSFPDTPEVEPIVRDFDDRLKRRPLADADLDWEFR